MRRALVTGACGPLGRELVDFLLEQGFELRAADLPDAARTGLNPRAEFRACDLSRQSTLTKLFDGVSRCYHLAQISDSKAGFIALYNANVIGTRNLLRAALPYKAALEALVVRSAAGVYGSYARGPFKEKDFLDPQDDFHKTMAAREEVAADFERAAGLPVVILRAAPVYAAARPKGKKAFLHAHDAARAAHFVSDRSGSIGDVFNLADDAFPDGLDTAKIKALGFSLRYPRAPRVRAVARRAAAPELGSV